METKKAKLFASARTYLSVSLTDGAAMIFFLLMLLPGIKRESVITNNKCRVAALKLDEQLDKHPT